MHGMHMPHINAGKPCSSSSSKCDINTEMISCPSKQITLAFRMSLRNWVLGVCIVGDEQKLLTKSFFRASNMSSTCIQYNKVVEGQWLAGLPGEAGIHSCVSCKNTAVLDRIHV